MLLPSSAAPTNGVVSRFAGCGRRREKQPGVNTGVRAEGGRPHEARLSSGVEFATAPISIKGAWGHPTNPSKRLNRSLLTIHPSLLSVLRYISWPTGSQRPSFACHPCEPISSLSYPHQCASQNPNFFSRYLFSLLWPLTTWPQPPSDMSTQQLAKQT